MTKQGKVVLIIAIVGACCVAGVTIILILAAIAIPALQTVMNKGYDATAVASVRTINSAEQQYNFTYPERGFSCSLMALGSTSQSGAPSADGAQLIPPDLGAGNKNGYTYAISGCVKEKDEVISYKLTAVPDSVGHTGMRGYCTDENGAITFDPKGGTNCTELLQ